MADPPHDNSQLPTAVASPTPNGARVRTFGSWSSVRRWELGVIAGVTMRRSIRACIWFVLALLALPSLAIAAGPDAADAAERRDAASLRALLGRKVDVNTPQPDGTTALHWAVHWNDVESTRLLLRAGADPMARNRFGASPLSEAAASGNAALVAALLEAGADAKARPTARRCL